MELDRDKFFASVRSSLFGGALKQTQVDGMNAILDAEWARKRHAAYALATTYHECATKMQPIIEYGNLSYFTKYNAGTKIGKSLGNTQIGDGFKYRGRGFVQLTGRANYAKASRKIGVDLINFPDRALQLPIATQILFMGMTEGWFTGKKLSDYINDIETNYVNARRIINGLDKASLIASYAEKFAAAIINEG